MPSVPASFCLDYLWEKNCRIRANRDAIPKRSASMQLIVRDPGIWRAIGCSFLANDCALELVAASRDGCITSSF
jgi:hypothetical protein